MAIVPKVWTASDVNMGKLVIVQQGTTLTFERRYTFVDALGNELDISGGRVVESVEWSDLPSDIQTALSSIDSFTKSRALTQEGMGSV